MKRYHLFGAAVGSAALAFAGTAAAANSGSATGFNQYTVDTNGNISLGSQCSTANGCVVLINEPGLLQARVADSVGNQFFQTINTDNADSAGPGAVAVDVNGHPTDFRNESFVGVGLDNTGPSSTNNNDGAYTVAALNYVDTGSETDGVSGQSYVDTFIRHGDTLPSFIAATGPELVINQQNIVGSGAQQVTANFQFKKNSINLTGDPFTTNGGAWMRIDQNGPINGTGDGSADYFTVRKSSGVFTTSGGSADPGTGAVIFTAGNYIQAVWMTSPVYNADGNGGTIGTNGTFEYASFNDFSTAAGGATTNDATAPSFDNSGITNVTWAAAGPNWWDQSPGYNVAPPVGPVGLVGILGATTDAFPTDPNLALGVVP